MAVTNEFREAVAAQNIRRVRIMMKDGLLIDPTGGSFDEMAEAAEGLAGLYDEHDGRELVEDESAWDDDYMDRLMVQAVGNFSHERLEHLKKVLRRLRPGSEGPVEQPIEQPIDRQIERPRERTSDGPRYERPSREAPRYKTGRGESSLRDRIHRGYNESDDWHRPAAGAAVGAVAGALIGGFAAVVVGAAIGAAAAKMTEESSGDGRGRRVR